MGRGPGAGTTSKGKVSLPGHSNLAFGVRGAAPGCRDVIRRVLVSKATWKVREVRWRSSQVVDVLDRRGLEERELALSRAACALVLLKDATRE